MSEIKTDVKDDVKDDVKVEAKAEAKVEVKAEVKAEAKAESKAEVKTEVKADVKAETKSKKTGVREFDLILFLLVITLSVCGLVMIYSASYVTAGKTTGDGAFFFKKQLVTFVLSLIIMAVVAIFDYRNYKKYCPQIYFGTLILLLAVFIPGIGKKVNGAYRWINFIGFRFQPSELAKLGAIIFTADFLSRKRFRKGHFFQIIVPLFIMIGFFSGIIVVQRDLSTAIEIIVVSFIMCFLAGLSMKSIFLTAGTGFFGFFVLIITEDYRFRRMLAFMDPWKDMQDSGYQIIQSLKAVGNGGFFGKGLGMAVSKHNYLPEEYTDFIFAVISEELGFLGGIFIVSLFAFIFYRGIKIALKCRDDFGRFLAGGIISIITVQAILNIGVVLSVLPTTGVTLPFISYGGSSLLVSFIMTGILLNISKTEYHLIEE
jgi:cell division protein FtsW